MLLINYKYTCVYNYVVLISITYISIYLYQILNYVTIALSLRLILFNLWFLKQCILIVMVEEEGRRKVIRVIKMINTVYLYYHR